MDRRLKLHNLLKDSFPGYEVYFQPPEGQNIKYPCIIYEISGYDKTPADNLRYKGMMKYSVMLISRKHSYQEVEQMMGLELVSLGSSFKTDGLYHYTFSLYF